MFGQSFLTRFRQRRQKRQQPRCLPGHNFAGQDLIGEDFRGADLTGAVFYAANLRDTDLRDAILRDADLSGARNLYAYQLGGADLTGAKLPEHIAKFEGLTQVADTSKNAATLFLTLLGVYAYIILTIAATTDVALILNSTTFQLPFVNTNVPVVGFYYGAPIVVVGVYLYFHLYLLRLWEGLADLPAVFQDGITLDRKIPPWLFNGIIADHLTRLDERRPAFTWLQAKFSVLLGWYLGPLVLAGIWFRYLCLHEPFPGTTLHVLTVVLSVALPFEVGKRARRALGHQNPLRNQKLSRPYVWTSYWRLALVAAIVGGLLALASGVALGVRGSMPLAYANVAEAALSQNRPSAWTGDKKQLAAIKGARLRERDLRGLEAKGSFAVKADLSSATLIQAHLSEADFTSADLSGANLSGATLIRTNLNGARLISATLTSATLWGAKLSGAELFSAHLNDARLNGADLSGAKLYRADLTSADLSGANLSGADLDRATLIGAKYTVGAKSTKWPKNFDSRKAGAIEVDEYGNPIPERRSVATKPPRKSSVSRRKQ